MIRSYSFLRQFISIIFFSLFFSIFLWGVSSFLMMEKIRHSSLENTHMVIVLDQNTTNADYQKIYGQLSFITTSIKPLSLDEVNQFARSSSGSRLSDSGKKMILLNLLMGKNAAGQRVTLSEQILSVHKILEGNKHVLLVEDNLPWAEKLDSLDFLMVHAKRAGMMLFGLFLLLLLLFWSFLFPAREKVEDSMEHQEKSFWKNSPSAPALSSGQGLRLGFFSALGACILLFLAHPALYSPSLDPFVSAGPAGIHSTWAYYFFSFPVMGGGLGWLSFQLGKIWRRVLH
ncbi:MAG: hypothetical protein ACYCXP_07775 [Leptospirillum sp.]